MKYGDEIGEAVMTDKKLPFEVHEELLRKLATRDSSKLLPMALDVLTQMRMAGATPEDIGFVLRFATALARAQSEEELHRNIDSIILEERHRATE